MKLYPFPEPKAHLRLRATSRGRREIYFDHSTAVIRNMGRNSLRRIHELKAMPTVDELQTWILDHHSKAFDYFDAAKVEKMAEDAAVFALDAFDAEEYERRVQRARNGGKLSGCKKGARGKRPPLHGTDALQEGLSIAQQAEQLGVSIATIKRMRARLKAETEAEQLAAAQADYEACFGPEEIKEEPVATVPDFVPTSWLDEQVELARREDIARATFADFDDIEVS